MTDLKNLTQDRLTRLDEAAISDAAAGEFVEYPRFNAVLAELNLSGIEPEEVEEEISRRERTELPDPATMTLNYNDWLGRLKGAQSKAAMACGHSGREASDAQVRKLAHVLATNNVRVAQVQIRGDQLDKQQASHLIDAFSSAS